MLETHVPVLVTVSRQAVVQALPSSSCPGAPMFGLVRHTSHRRWDWVDRVLDQPASGSAWADDWPGSAPQSKGI